MTVEERAQKAVEKFCEDEAELRGPDKKRPVSFVAYSSKLRQRISEVLRDQIEDCAKILDEWAKINIEHQRSYEADIMKISALAIRALAASKEEDQIRARSEG